jgi:hypothetical protein
MGEWFLGMAAGLAVALILVMATYPEHKSNCDAFGATRFAGQVYVCHPKVNP